MNQKLQVYLETSGALESTRGRKLGRLKLYKNTLFLNNGLLGQAGTQVCSLGVVRWIVCVPSNPWQNVRGKELKSSKNGSQSPIKVNTLR
jgi:hypothetical protein